MTRRRTAQDETTGVILSAAKTLVDLRAAAPMPRSFAALRMTTTTPVQKTDRFAGANAQRRPAKALRAHCEELPLLTSGKERDADAPAAYTEVSAVCIARYLQVPAPVAISGNGGGSGRGLSARLFSASAPDV